MVHLMRDYRAGKLKLFTAARKPVTAGATSAKERPRHRAIQLRLLSTYEISARLAVEGNLPACPTPYSFANGARSGYTRNSPHA